MAGVLAGVFTFFTGDTPFIGDSLRGFDDERTVADFLTDSACFFTDLGFSASDVSGKAEIINPRLSDYLTGEAGLACFTTLLLSLTIAISAAAALLPLSLLRGRPRAVSYREGALTLGSGAVFSFFGADLDLVGCLLGAGFFAGDFDFFCFSVYFLGGALLERDYAFDLLLDLAGVFLAAYFRDFDFETDFLTDALADGLTSAFAVEGLAVVGFTTEALATDFLATDAFLTDYTLGDDFTSSNLAGDFLLGDDFLLGEEERLGGEGDFCGVFLPIDF